MHREIIDVPAGKVVDHADGNRCNACRSNLRACGYDENGSNRRKRRTGSSRFKGVSLCRLTGKWDARCGPKSRPRHLGYFDDEVEAARAYDFAAVQRSGEFAHLNFPREWPPERRSKVREEYLRAAAK